MVTCPACGQENPDSSRFCGMCGAALAPAAAPPREERKVVTILFTDLVGSTARAEGLDPEDVSATLSAYYAQLRAELERHGGTVEKFIGDAVMAVFGAPVAHEDDAERAVRAALAIRDSIGEELQIRTAVNTGEALVALGAKPGEGDAMVAGDVVNTAARLQGAAPVNGILVGEGTYRATRQSIDYREAPPVEAKGKAEPVKVWEAVGARSRFGSDVEQKLRTPLVGRERERGLLADALDARAHGAVGPARHARRRARDRQEPSRRRAVPDHRGRSRPHHLAPGPLAPLRRARELLGARRDRQGPCRDPRVRRHGDGGGEARRDGRGARGGRAGAGLARPPHTPARRPRGRRAADREEAFAAWRRLLEAAAEQRPLVLVFEDLHWADDGLLDFVDHLADWATTVPLLIVAPLGPSCSTAVPAGVAESETRSRCRSARCRDEETAQSCSSACSTAPCSTPRLSRPCCSARRATRSTRRSTRGCSPSTATATLALPETVQGLIAARIDGLAPEEKSLLQDASVIGKVFWPGALANSDERVLHALERKEFVRRDRRSAIAGETQYAFLHALVRDVGYGQIPRSDRADKHRRAAEWLASLAGDRAEDHAEMLAYHYREALALSEAAGLDASAAAGARATRLRGCRAAGSLARRKPHRV